MYMMLMGMPEEKRPLGPSRCRWVDNVRVDLRVRAWVGKDWIDLAQGRHQCRILENTVVSLLAL
jgi:hypothetical protein